MDAIARWDAECRRANGERRRQTTATTLETPELFESLETCPACKENYVQCTTLQTRGADESMTEFYWCAKCQHRWKS